jgi:alpha-galactosidase/6-phospho-beta-glucosidase family protein
MEAERELLETHGYYRGIAVNAPYRQLRLMHDTALDVESRCPNAYLLQCSNPLPEGCTLIRMRTLIPLSPRSHCNRHPRQL